MGRINFVISDELEERFREEISKRKGLKKGNISNAIEEAIVLWMNEGQQKRSNAAKKAWKKRKEKS